MPIGQKPPDLDDAGNPVQTSQVSGKPPDLDDSGNPVNSEQGFASQVWDAINKPLLPIFSELGHAGAERLDAPDENAWRIPFTGGATWQGLGAGMLQGAGDVVSSLTSPLNLATAAATGGSSLALRGGLTGTAKGLQTIGRGLSYPVMGHGALETAKGAANAFDPNIGLDESFGQMGRGLTELAGGKIGTKHVAKTTGPIVSRLPQKWFPENVPTSLADTPGVIPDTIPVNEPGPGLENTGRIVLKKPTPEAIKAATDAGYMAVETTPDGGVVLMRPDRWAQSMRPPIQAAIDPNLNQGMGDAELAGSVPYQPAPEPVAPPVQQQPPTRTTAARLQRFPGDEAFDLGPIGNEPIDLSQSMQDLSPLPIPPEKGGGPTNRMMFELSQARGAENNMARPSGQQFGDQVLPPEFQPDMMLTPQELAPTQVPPMETSPFSNQFDPRISGMMNEPTELMPPPRKVLEPELVVDEPAPVINPDEGVPFDLENPDPSDFFIRDAERMRREAATRPFNQERADDNAIWNNRQKRTAIYEGRNINDIHTPLDPRQEQMRAANDRIRQFSDEHSQRFAEQEALLPEDQFYQEPPEQKAAFDAEYSRLQDERNALAERLYPEELAALKDPPPDIPVGSPLSFRNMMADERGMVGPNINPKPEPPFNPTGPTINMKNPTIENLKKAFQAGYTYSGEVAADGSWILKKGKAPILEAEVEGHRPTTVGARGGEPPPPKKRSAIVEAYNLPRGMMATADFSAPLRQGIGLIHKKEFWQAVPEMFRAWASEEGYNRIQNEIKNKPLFRERSDSTGKKYPSFAEDAGLKLMDLSDDLTHREEAIMSRLVEKIPLARRSNRAYTAFLNKLRADTFETLVRDSKVFAGDAKANLPMARDLAKFVNAASGRGSLGQLESSAVALNQLLFSPRLIASRLQMMNPQNYIFHPNKTVRMEHLKSLLMIATVGNTLTQLPRMMGIGEVSQDPSSSDFGKLKIGNTRLDPYGGFQQYIVAANRLMNPLGPATGFEGGTPFTRGQMVTSSNDASAEYDLWNPQRPFDPVPYDVAERFVRGKMHPVIGFAWSLIKGKKEMSGEPMNFTTTNPMDNAIAQRFIPLLFQDLNELYQENPKLFPFLAPLMAFGMGSQTYGAQKPE
jgi:hypothetical protein